MKLRNKKTGEIGDLLGSERSCPYITIDIDFHDGNPRAFDYTSLAELNEEWEDCGPRITDPTIRRAVKAWAEANEYDKLWVYHDHTAISFYNEDDGDNEIVFNTIEKFGLEHLKCYTVIELCGEEEE